MSNTTDELVARCPFLTNQGETMLPQVRFSSSVCCSLCVLSLLAILASRACADIWDVPKTKETISENGKYVFRIVPALRDHDRRQRGTSRGILLTKNGEELVLQWGRPLVNDICPIDARVSNSGKYVVTVGEWYDYEKLPFVLYTVKGSLINVYGKLEQLLPDDCDDPKKQLPYSLSGRHWLSHSLLFFEPNDEFFVVRLSTKDILVFDLWLGELVDDKWIDGNFMFPERIKKYADLKENLARLVVIEALRLTSSKRHKERDDGQFVLSQCRDPKSIRILQDAMHNPTSRIVDTPQGKIREYPIRNAAREALMAMGEMFPETDEGCNEEKH